MVTGCVSNSAFASLVGIPINIVSSVVWLKICAIAAGIKKYKLRMLWVMCYCVLFWFGSTLALQ